MVYDWINFIPSARMVKSMPNQDGKSFNRFDDDELVGILRGLNDAEFAGQLSRSEECCSGIRKLFVDAVARGLDIGQFPDIADLAPQEAPGLAGPR